MSMRWLLVCLFLGGCLVGCGGGKEIKPDSSADVKVDPKTYEDQMRKSMEYMSKNNPKMKAQMEAQLKKMTDGSAPAGTPGAAPAEAPAK